MNKKIDKDKSLSEAVEEAQEIKTSGGSISSRIDEIQAEIMKETAEKKPEYFGLYKYQTRLAAMAIAVSECLCGELSGSNPSEWVMEQTSREGNARSKADPKVKELATYLQLSGQLLDKCKDLVWRV